MKKRAFYKTPKKEMAEYVARGIDFVMNDQNGIFPFYADDLTLAVLQVGRIREGLRNFVVSAVLPKIKKAMHVRFKKTLRYNKRTKQWEPTDKGMPEVQRKLGDAMARLISPGIQLDIDIAEGKKVTSREKQLLTGLKETQKTAKHIQGEIEYLEDKQSKKAQEIIKRIRAV